MVTITVIGLRGIPDVMGGIETHCAELLPRLLENAAPGALTITLLARHRYVAARGDVEGIRQIPLWAPKSAALETIVHTFLALIYARFVLRSDLVHLHAIGPGLLAPLARLLGFSLLFTHHGADYRREKWGAFSRMMLRLGERLAVRFSHGVITVSPATADELRARFPARADRIVHIPNGFNHAPAERATPEVLARYGLSAGRYVISVGRLVPEKAQDVLIEAFAASALPRGDTPWKLLIVGDADHANDYARAIAGRAEGDDTVVLAGRIPRRTVLALNTASGLFVLPSYHEGLSIAALEAINAGVPVLLSDIDANRHIGLPDINYFPAGSGRALTAKLDSEFAVLAPGSDFDLSPFEWSTIARATLARIDALAGGGTLGRAAPPPTDQCSDV